MAYEKLSVRSLHRKLRKTLRLIWTTAVDLFRDAGARLSWALRRIEKSLRIRYIETELRRRRRSDLVACAYNGAFRKWEVA